MPLLHLIRLAVFLVFLHATGLAVAQELDTKLVKESKAEAEILWRRGFTLGDESLDRELQSVLDRMVAGQKVDPAIHLTAHVFRSPDLNAFALPDGSIYVFAGLLARLNSRDEMAFILGHEAQHAIGWHAQKHISDTKANVAVYQALSLTATVALGTSSISGASLIHSFTQLGLQLVTLAAVNGYGRALESEADDAGVTMMGPAGYDPCGSVRALRALLAEDKDPSRTANVFWGNHPLLKDRIKDMQVEAGAECPADSFIAGEGFDGLKWRMAKLTARLWLAAENDTQAVKAASAYVERFPFDYDALTLLGDIYARSKNPDTLGLAAESYQEALSLAEGDYRTPYRGLATVTEALRDTAGTIDALEKYLAGDAQVPDRRAFKRKLEELRSHYKGSAGRARDSTGAPAMEGG